MLPPAAYPVGCLLPSALGSCADWAPRWYFIASVGRCNRFWYGGCHGNANNFASEEECMSSCRGAQPAPGQPEPGAAGQSAHSSPWGQREAGQHRPGAAPWGPELGSSTPGLGGDAGRPAPPSHSSSYR